YIESREDAVAREVQAEVIDEVEAELKEEIEKDKAELAEEEAEIKKDKKEADESRELLEKIKDPEKPKLKKKGFFAKMFGKKEKFPEAEKEKPVESDAEKAPIEAKEKKKGVLSGIFEKKLSDAEFEKFFRTLEISLLESNVAYEIIDMIKERLKSQLINKQIRRGKVESIINETLETVFREVLMETEPDKIIKKIENNKSNEEPTKFLFLGVNGVGKTTNMSKLAGWLQGKGYSCVFAASDTFRAASIEQLEKHGSNLGIRVVKHTYGADAAAVAFDAIEHARAKKINCVLIDSAGRQHTNANLMDELHKLKRVAKPDFTVFVADSMTGNDAVEQAREFGDKVGFDWSILAKADVDQKGGAILSVSYISKKPIAFLGVGQEYKDLEPFNKENMIRKILGD
ncbi:MAG TPA: signal recognition particle-docking protein FtsY, partial [Candidatus Woesearchaeota archaeon]|nr:signal recognition particle-docking protein FtsY [Candidatus Woesearchaeota archaeon]